MKLCKKCWKTNCNCIDSQKIEIDDNIAEIISILNLKGYTTLFCCGGHINKDSIIRGCPPNIYISFTKNINIIASDIGKDWKWYRNINTLRYIDKSIKKYEDNNHILTESICLKLQDNLDSKIYELYKWVKDLPPIKK